MNLSNNFKKFMGMVEEGVENVKAVGKAAKTAVEIQLMDEPTWAKHAAVDQGKTKPFFQQEYGGYNRKSRNAASFYGGYDAAMRWPDRLEELKTLAKGYQMIQAGKSVGQEGASFKEDMLDALANISGIEAAQRDIETGLKVDMGEDLVEDVLEKARQYSNKYSD